MRQPTLTQLTALRLAEVEPLRYFRGGWYSIPSEAKGLGQTEPRRNFHGANVTAQTIAACCDAGWLARATQESIYDKRWTLTDAGRAVLATMETT